MDASNNYSSTNEYVETYCTVKKEKAFALSELTASSSEGGAGTASISEEGHEGSTGQQSLNKQKKDLHSNGDLSQQGDGNCGLLSVQEKYVYTSGEGLEALETEKLSARESDKQDSCERSKVAPITVETSTNLKNKFKERNNAEEIGEESNLKKERNVMVKELQERRMDKGVMIDGKKKKRALVCTTRKKKRFQSKWIPKEEDEDDPRADELEVEKIVGRRIRRGKYEYLQKWKGLSDEHNTWEMLDNLDCMDMVKSYETEKKARDVEKQKERKRKLNEQLNAKKRLKRGLSEDEEPGGLECRMCLTVFENEVDFSSHEGAHSRVDGQAFTCNICEKAFESLATLDKHIRRKHGNETKKQFKCTDCNRFFGHKDTAARHYGGRTDGPKPFHCEVCSTSFGLVGHLTQHIKYHTHEKPYLCSECGAAFTKKVCLRGHLKMHEKCKRYICEFCKAGFRVKSEYVKHQGTHKVLIKYDCEECEETFSNRTELRKHASAVHKPNEVFSCDVCHQSFDKKLNFKVHMKKHDSSKPFRCDACNFYFNKIGSLKSHKCEFAQVNNPAFTNANARRKEWLTPLSSLPLVNGDEDVERYHCPACDRLFGRKRSLTRHKCPAREGATSQEKRPKKLQPQSGKMSLPTTFQYHPMEPPQPQPPRPVVQRVLAADEATKALPPPLIPNPPENRTWPTEPTVMGVQSYMITYL